MTPEKASVIGGGCVGLGIARALAGAGFQVTVFEKAATFGAEASRAAAGMIGPQSEAMEDDAYFAATLNSRDLWPQYALELESETGIALGYSTRGALHLAFGAAYEKRLEAKYLWQKKRAGALEHLQAATLKERYPYLHPRVSSAYWAQGDHWIDNEKLMDALEASCRMRGVLLRPSEAWSGPAGGITIVAAGAWAGTLFPELARVHPVKGQMLSFKAPAALMPDMPIHAEFVYLVPRGRDRILVGATVETCGFDKRHTGEGIEWLLQNAFETIPDLRSCEVDRIWAGLRPGSADGWPVLGPSPQKNVFLACGHYRRGILFLPLTVKALLGSVQGEPLPEAARAFGFDHPLRGAPGGL